MDAHPERRASVVAREDDQDSMAVMRGLLEKYSHDLPRHGASQSRPTTRNMTVLLTGSTGSLGSYLLDTLYHDSKVQHIICLNRSSKAADVHSMNGPVRGLSRVNPSRVEFFKADLSRDQFDLENSVYQRLLSTVTHVIHNQWPANFNWPPRSFEPDIRGVRHLVDLSIASAHNAHITFISSVSAVGSWKGAGQVPERSFPDLNMAAELGYGQSKLIAENLFEKASQISRVRSACCRVGIVAGPVEQRLGLWNKHEYILSIIVSFPHLGVFPATFPSRDRVDWLPVDKLSRIVVEILLSSCDTSHSLESGTQMYHVVNPKTTSWKATFAREVLSRYPQSTSVRPVIFEDWLRALGDSAAEMDRDCTLEVNRNPAIRLLDFHSGASKPGQEPRSFISSRAEKASRTLREIEPVNGEWVGNWMMQWGLMGDQESTP